MGKKESNEMIHKNNYSFQFKQFNPIDSYLAKPSQRIPDLLLDVIIIIILVVVVVSSFSINSTIKQNVLTFFIVFFYYFISEFFFHKTIGKLITGVKVVKTSGESPKAREILARTIVRLTVSEALSFLFSKVGLHDLLSETIVVRKDFPKVQSITLKEDDKDFDNNGQIQNIFLNRIIFKLFRKYPITFILLMLNILFYLILAFNCKNFFDICHPILNRVSIGYYATIIEQKWWHLLTAVFSHIDIQHLTGNLYGLLFFGLLLEPVIKQKKFLLAYFTTAFFTNFLYLCQYHLWGAVGASGAIFGIIGTFLGYLISSTDFEKTFKKKLILFIIVQVILEIYITYDDEKIYTLGHIMGFISGLLIGLLYNSFRNKKQSERDRLYAKLIFIVIIISILVAKITTTPDKTKFYYYINNINVNNNLGLEIFTNDNHNITIKKINDFTFYYWKKNISILKKMNRLDLPESVKQKNKQLKSLYELSISYNIEKLTPKDSVAFIKKQKEINKKILDAFQLYH